MRGSGAIEVEGERVELDARRARARRPRHKRKVFAGPEGLRMLALGGNPARPTSQWFTELTQRQR